MTAYLNMKDLPELLEEAHLHDVEDSRKSSRNIGPVNSEISMPVDQGGNPGGGSGGGGGGSRSSCRFNVCIDI